MIEKHSKAMEMIRCGAWAALSATPVLAAPPVPDHIVIVIEENHGLSQVIGSPEAPYMNSLAQSGLLFTNFFAITHPSQPNYLQLFSGSNQGMTTNDVPPGTPFSSPNLGASIIAAGLTFATYSEDLPDVGSDVVSALGYVRRHNPCANWQASNPGVNQFPLSVNRPFFSPRPAAFPFFGDLGGSPDYSELPTVTIVVPNLSNDMHDGTIQQADNWLATWIDPYVQWAQTHNSLLVIAWDEDNSASRNRIPMIVHGPMIDRGQNNVMFTLHNLLRTVEDMYSAAPSGIAAKVRPIVGAFATDVAITTRSFQKGVNGYSGVRDTYVESANGNSGHGSTTAIVVDGSPLSHGLIRFDSIIGNQAGQVPPGATVLSAKLALLTAPESGSLSADTMSLHRMLVDWNEASTWNSMGNGISANGVEASSSSDFSLLANISDHWAIFDVSDTVQAWVNAADPVGSNRGWVIIPSGTDGWRFVSSDAPPAAADGPVLEITFRTPCQADVIHSWTVDIDDLVAVITSWDATRGAADINRDHIVDIDDLVAVINAWGSCP